MKEKAKKRKGSPRASHPIPSSAKEKKKERKQTAAPLRMSLCLTYLPTLRYHTSARQEEGYCNTMIWNSSSDGIRCSAVLWLLRTVANEVANVPHKQPISILLAGQSINQSSINSNNFIMYMRQASLSTARAAWQDSYCPQW